MNLIDGSLLIMATAMVVLLYLLLQSDRKLTWFKSLSKPTPVKYVLESNGKKLNQIITLIPELTLSERQFLITSIFDRPVRFSIVQDQDGQSSIEGCWIYEPSEADTHIHLNKMMKEGRGGIC